MEIKISPTVTPEQREDPRFKKLFQQTTTYFNSPNPNLFTKKQRDLICIHESGHIVYARLAGVTDMNFYGPTLYWCSGCPGCPGNTPALSNASINFTWPDVVTISAVLKTKIAGVVFREILTDTPNDAVAIWRDTQDGRTIYHKISLDEDAFQRDLKAARDAVIEDLQSSEFQELAWKTAKEFGREIFPAPKLTKAILRQRRLGWV
jgi:hypothetical protein